MASKPSPSVTLDLSEVPRPNWEFVVYVAALLIAVIIVGVADTLVVNDWFLFFLVTTSIYILSRGIAKAHNVKE
jgi:uncharacterized membrane protein